MKHNLEAIIKSGREVWVCGVECHHESAALLLLVSMCSKDERKILDAQKSRMEPCAKGPLHSVDPIFPLFQSAAIFEAHPAGTLRFT